MTGQQHSRGRRQTGGNVHLRSKPLNYASSIFVSALIGALSISLLWGVLSIGQTKQETAPGKSQPGSSWIEVDRLISGQKFAEAAGLVEKILTAAQKAGDQDQWTRALVREVQLRIGLHGYETSVRFLKEQPWPDGLLNRTTLNLFYASSLVVYYHSYSWEINRREKVESEASVDLKAWTRDQIFAEAQKAYNEVWRQRAALGEDPVTRLTEYLDRNNYPEGIRGTLRDAVSYLYIDLLSDTSFWRPEQSNEIYRLDLKALLRRDSSAGHDEASILDAGTHPLVKIVLLLSDLESWHASTGRPEATLEARLVRLQRLHASFTDSLDRSAIEEDLAERLLKFRNLPWWAMGKATLAEFIRQEDRTGRLARARSIAVEGYEAYPDSVGGKRCFSILKTIDASDFNLTSMSSDGFRKRSIEISHKNLPSLYFRAYSLDLERRIGTVVDYNLLPNAREQSGIIKTQRPAAEWRAELPPTPDFEFHRTFVVPPLKAPGFYVVVLSVKPDFSDGPGNKVLAVNLIVSDIVLIYQNDRESSLTVRALSGETGSPVAGVSVSLYRYDYQTRHQKVDEQVSDNEGLARFSFASGRGNALHFLLAKKGAQIALSPGDHYFYHPVSPEEITASLLYTDRSIYRPLQKVFWKVLVYRGNTDQARLRTFPATAVTVSLQDPNGERVDSLAVSTNSFGSAAGVFTIPPGRLLGSWRLQSSLNGHANLRVEEYKRPTFEVSIKDPEEPLRLNRVATLTGDVKYYFGLPVVNGSARWRVTREPIYPWYWDWGWRGSRRTARQQIIASGVSTLGADGTFGFTFTPEADERQASSKDITYRYAVVADVTDEGGETRSASRSFRLGFVAIEARMDADTGFFREGMPGRLAVTRTDLNGIPRAGSGAWRLVSLVQPERAMPPADMPLQPPRRTGRENEYLTPGDTLRPRWNTSYTYQTVLREWADGLERGRGQLRHEPDGQARLDLPALQAGAYRVYYSTLDDFGAAYQTSREFIVAGRRTHVALPLLLIAEQSSQTVGGTARFLALSGLSDQILFLEIWRGGRLTERRKLASGQDSSLIEIPIDEKDRGGFSIRLSALCDYQMMDFDQSVFVPWDNKKLNVQFSTFRDKIRPGARETWRVTVKSPSGAGVEAGAAELLAYMYDRSLDIFAPHVPADLLSIYPHRAWAGQIGTSLGQSGAQWLVNHLFSPPGFLSLVPDRLKFYDQYGIGGPGNRYRGRGGVVGGVAGGVAGGVMSEAAQTMEEFRTDAAPQLAAGAVPMKDKKEANAAGSLERAPAPAPESTVQLRSDFAETAFWSPQLLTDAEGSAVIEFQAPDSVTSWNVWVHAVTRDLMGGSIHKEARSVKELMVRPYLPRFLREGDKSNLKVVVNNASDNDLKGKVTFDIVDPGTNESLLSKFGLPAGGAVQPFAAAARGGANLSYPITVPPRIGLVAFRIMATAGDTSDGELRPVPVLPGRMHLSQSRFVTLRNKDRREMHFEDLKKGGDATLINDQLVVTLDAQLFYSVLSALPYLISYPYECTEQTLNRFVSTGILSSLYDKYPAVSRMAAEFAKRDTQLETWDSADPNRKIALEETPWLTEAGGGKDAGLGLTNVLDPRITRVEKEAALAKLRKAQTASGGFPWWAGGPPSPYMTLYIMYGFAKAAEFGVEVPRDSVQRGWNYLALHFREEYAQKMLRENCCWEFLTFLNYVASCYLDPSWMGNALTPKERKDILDHCFRHWKQHSPYLKCELALTLQRMGRPQDALMVFASVMDSAKSTPDQGTFWAPEDRSWLWYNDTIETQAFALRTLLEITPDNPKKDGLIQWLFLNKKLNHWKSTRATAEVIYSLVHYLKREGSIGGREDATVKVGGQTIQYLFEPDRYTGKKNQTVIPGEKVSAGEATIIVEKESRGFVFASATWQFSTEQLPEEGRGDFLSVTRSYFKRENTGKEFVLRPLAEGTILQPGDEVEVRLSILAKHPCEYMHLRDPRAAGLEPENAVSRYRWDSGIGWYEETRDSGTNFFFEWLPQGEYTFKYRLRANMAGVFRVSPATLQSMYAPEFSAYSAGAVLTVK